MVRIKQFFFNFKSISNHYHFYVSVEKHVAKPYTVEVPHPVPVAKPYKVHPVQQVVETPVIDQHHVTVHQPAVAVAHAAPVAYAHAAAPGNYLMP